MAKKGVVNKKKPVGAMIAIITILVVLDIVILTFQNCQGRDLAKETATESEQVIAEQEQTPEAKDYTGEFSKSWGGSSWVSTDDPSVSLYISPDSTIIEQTSKDRYEGAFTVSELKVGRAASSGIWKIKDKEAAFELTMADDGITIKSGAFLYATTYKLQGGGGGGGE